MDEWARTEQTLRQQLDDQAETLRSVRQAGDARLVDVEGRHKAQLNMVRACVPACVCDACNGVCVHC